MPSELDVLEFRDWTVRVPELGRYRWEAGEEDGYERSRELSKVLILSFVFASTNP